VTVLARIFPGRTVLLLLPDPRSDRLVAAAAAGPGSSERARLTLDRQGTLARALTGDAKTLALSEPTPDAPLDEGLLPGDTLTPLLTHGNLAGVLVLGARRRHGLNNFQSVLAAELSTQAAVALENAQLYASLRVAFTDLETAQRELLALQQASTAAQSSLNLQDVLHSVTNGVVESLEYIEVLLYLLDPLTKTVRLACSAGRLLDASQRASITESICPGPRLSRKNDLTSALLRGEIHVSADAGTSLLPILLDLEHLGGPDVLRGRTVVNVPLIASGEVVGGMALLSDRQVVAAHEYGLLQGFAAQAASAIVNARLYEDLRDSYNMLRVTQDELVRAERLRSLGELASTVAHDFNNILLAILTRAQLATRESDPAALRHALAVIEGAAHDGSEVVRRIQNLARTKAPKTSETVDLNGILRGSLEIAQPVWQATAEARERPLLTEVDFGPTAPVAGDPTELRELFVNLLMNAFHAMPQGGIITLRTFTQDGHAWAEVRDTGIGMTDEVKRRVFEPFFTTKGSAGSGLGMSIVASIAQRHSGLIELESAPGCGTSVCVGFPLLRAGEASRTAAPRRVQMRERLQVLVVDHNQHARESLVLLLEQLGHEVRACIDGQEALPLFLDGEYSAVFTDVNRDGFSGWDVARAVKRMRTGTEVILMTGWAAGLDTDDPTRGCVDHILTKPFTLEDVAAALAGARGGTTARASA
jgi:signal transduction histidine kinase/CheY-like chemotaxis protein